MIEVKKYLSSDGSIRIASAVTTSLIEDVIRHQSHSLLSMTLLARATTGAVLMASQTKEAQMIALHFIGDGPVGQIYAEAAYDGRVRAYVQNKQAELPESQTKIGSGLGQGRLEVVTSQSWTDQPHRGMVELFSGEVGEDIAYYLNQSQQIPAIVTIAAVPNETGLELSGGYIVELMPGYDEHTIERLEVLYQGMQHPSELIRKGAGAEDLVKPILDLWDFKELKHPYSFEHVCVCSKSKALHSVKLLGKEEVADMVKNGEDAQIQCEFCGANYKITCKQLANLNFDTVLDQSE